MSVITPEEKEAIIKHAGAGKKLPEDLRHKLFASVESGEPSIFPDDSNYLCCDLGLDPPNRYLWTTFDNCRALGGSAASNDQCPRTVEPGPTTPKDGSPVNMGNGVQFQVFGHENDMIRFMINGAHIGTDQVKDVGVWVVDFRIYGATYVVAIIHGREKDQSYGYAITGNRVLKSPLWRDTTPGTLNLGGVGWSGNNTFTLDNRGTMSFNGNWNCTSGSGAVIEHTQVYLADMS